VGVAAVVEVGVAAAEEVGVAAEVGNILVQQLEQEPAKGSRDRLRKR